MGELKKLGLTLEKSIETALRNTGDYIVADMRHRLLAGHHYDTGKLYNSVRSETEVTKDAVTTYIYADAQSEDGAYYAEFIEYGTGAAHGREGGRVGKWSYKDSHGQWHTTDGMDADPFIRPSLQDAMKYLDSVIPEVIDDTIKYGRGKAQ